MLQHHWCNTRRDSASYCNWKKSTRTQSALAFAISQCSVNLINITCANSVNVTQSILISKSKGKADDFRMFPGFCQKERIFFAHQTKEPVFAKKHCLQFCKNSRLEKYLFSDHWQNWKLENRVSWQKPFYLSPTRVLPFLQPKNILLDILVTLPMLLFTLLVFSCLWNIQLLVIFNHYYENLCNIIVTLNVRLDLLPPSTKPTRTKSPTMTSAVFALN